MMTLQERAAAFAATFPKRPASHLHLVEEQGQPVLYGRWLIGAMFRNPSLFYGAYPAGYLHRVMALFPDIAGIDTLHVFSGSLAPGAYLRCDARQDAELQCSVYELPMQVPQRYRLIIADPPYSKDDAKKYRTPMIDRRRTTAALADCALPGAFLVWLDTCWPQHRKDQWRTCARIALTRSTNHRLRDITIFERQEGGIA